MPVSELLHGALGHVRRRETRRAYELIGDRELLARFLADRDELAFAELLNRHGPMVRAVCRRILGPSADADDAFQATFLVLVRKIRTLKRADLLANWLCAVAYRTSRQAQRRRTRLGLRERAGNEFPEPLQYDDAPRDWLPLFDAALQRLPSRYRDAVVLCELQGLSRPAAARMLGLKEGTLSSRLGRARDLLRKRLCRHSFPLAIGGALTPAIVPEALTAATLAAAMNASAASVSAIVLTEGVVSAMFVSKLKTALAGVAVVVVGAMVGLQATGPQTFGGGPPVLAQPAKGTAPRRADEKSPPPVVRPAPTNPDLAPFQGEWVVNSVAHDGKLQALEGIGIDEEWKFTNDTLTTGGEAKEEAVEKFTINAGAKPPTIDFALSLFTGDGTGRIDREAYQGIYRFEPDGRLLICFRRKAENVLRPSRFVTAHNSGATLVTLVRPRPVQPPLALAGTVYTPVTSYVASSTIPPQASPPVSVNAPYAVGPAARLGGDLERLQGIWLPVNKGGKAGDPNAALEILYDRVLLSSEHGRIRLDETVVPIRLTIVISRPERDVTVGIYRLDGDKLTIASHDRSAKLIPTDFVEGDGISVVEFTRVKAQASPVVEEAVRIEPPRAAPTVPTHVRDVQSEINQIREQLRRLEELLRTQNQVPRQ